MIESWLRRLDPHLRPDDAFSRMRGRQLATAGRVFDQAGGRDVAEFLSFVERYTVRDSDAAGAIRIMTVHKAKGLGFDLVILPDLEGNTLAERRGGLAVQKGPDRTIDWVFQLPVQGLARMDPVLAAHIAEAEAAACYENLCLLYVAMTRAKQAMYLVTEAVGKSRSANFPRLLQETLGTAWSSGDPRWFERSVLSPDAPEAARNGLQVLRDTPMPAAPRRAARRPSAGKSGYVDAAAAFTLEAASGSDFGSAVHDLLAGVEWASPEAAEGLAGAGAAGKRPRGGRGAGLPGRPGTGRGLGPAGGCARGSLAGAALRDGARRRLGDRRVRPGGHHARQFRPPARRRRL